MLIKRIFFIVLFLNTLQLNFARCQSVINKSDEVINKFFYYFQNKKYEIALDSLYSNNLWLNVDSETNVEIIKQLKSLNNTELFGKYCGYDLVKKEMIGESMVAYSYMVKFQRQPFRMIFIFYKPEKVWSIYSFIIDDKVDEELKERIKN